MAERTTGLVLHADVAPEGSWRMWRGTVEVLVDLGGRPTPLMRKFRLDEHRWLVPGMEVQVDIDPAKPEDFDIDWDAVPSIQDRVAAGDPTLTDPVAAHRRVAEAWGQQPKEPSGRFEQAMERAASTPAPAGQVRAVVRIATIRGNLEGDGDTGGGHARDTTIWGTSAAVLQVNVPGQAPYAVFVKKFKVPRGRIEITGAGLPALVSISDPNAVTMLWDEVPSAMSQVETRLGDAMSQMQAAVAAPQPMPQYADPEFQKTMVEGAKRALSMIPDPAQRAAMIQQYRAAGIMVEEE